MLKNDQRKYVKLTLYCLAIFAVIFCVSALCQDSKNICGWPLPIYDDGCRALMKAFHQEWLKADGELTLVFGEEMIWALLLNPNAFYKEFASDTVNYKRFFEDLDVLVFWNMNDSATVPLENLRTVAIDRLIDMGFSIDAEYLQLHEEMIANLRKLKVSYVD